MASSDFRHPEVAAQRPAKDAADRNQLYPISECLNAQVGNSQLGSRRPFEARAWRGRLTVTDNFQEHAFKE
jgi:hypothetical protein